MGGSSTKVGKHLEISESSGKIKAYGNGSM